MQASEIRHLIGRLEHLKEALRARTSANRELDKDDPLVKEASACELMLPSILTVSNLLETVERKLSTAAVLLERAAGHEALSPDVQLVADEGYLADEDDMDVAGRQHKLERRHANP
ncbi:hypothetical protein [Noviherbaspirillum sp. ST9]|uniref:hypothetical protein n=1 Tax=Noviherbaspirillum sp. ST9 TaxID=3401606 RepID=UPI003B58AA99